MKRVAVLGSTGSIGRQTLDIISQHPDRLQAVALTAHSSADLLKEQAAAFGVTQIALMDESAASAAGIPGGMNAIRDIACSPNVDIVVVSVAGMVGLIPTMAAIEEGKMIALASKEVLVGAGEVVMKKVREKGVMMTPIDSEHSALFQCLQGYTSDQVESLILTASGGPFRGKTREDLKNVTAKDALAHPTWNMGGKITVDSASLMNKGLEVIEAHWLFGKSIDEVEVVVHPQSVIHSMVRFKDGSVLGQLGWPDMRLPIQYALLYPERKANSLKPWNPVETPNLTFEKPDFDTFRCLGLAFESARVGKTMPCVMNAANEIAANAFLKEQCGFLQIADIVEETMSRHTVAEPQYESLLEADHWARETARGLLGI